MLRIFFFFQAEDGIRDLYVTGVQTCALPISRSRIAQPMNFSKPSGVVGGGEMNFATSSVRSIESSDVASAFTSSRSIMRRPLKIGRPLVQSATTSIFGAASGASKRIGSRFGIIAVATFVIDVVWEFII